MLPIDANTARRRANGWLADRVGHLVLGKDPRMLLDGKRALWRVTAYVTNVYREPFGPIGFVDVDAASGEVLSGDDVAQELQQRGAHLERRLLAAEDRDRLSGCMCPVRCGSVHRKEALE